MSTSGTRPVLSPVPRYRPPWWRKFFPAGPVHERHVRPHGRLWRISVMLAALLGSLVIVFGCLGVLYGIAIGGQGDQPEQAAREFCAAEAGQDYGAAYELLAGDAVKQSGAQFYSWSVGRDRQYGTIQRCDVLGRDYIKEIDPNGAAFDVQVVFARGTTVTGAIVLHRYRPGGGLIGIPEGKIIWAIFSVDPGLHLAAT